MKGVCNAILKTGKRKGEVCGRILKNNSCRYHGDTPSRRNSLDNISTFNDLDTIYSGSNLSLPSLSSTLEDVENTLQRYSIQIENLDMNRLVESSENSRRLKNIEKTLDSLSKRLKSLEIYNGKKSWITSVLGK